MAALATAKKKMSSEGYLKYSSRICFGASGRQGEVATPLKWLGAPRLWGEFSVGGLRYPCPV